MAAEVRKHLDTMTTLLGTLTPPDLVLNPHCTACEFQVRCRKIATENDDLSLLARMTGEIRDIIKGSATGKGLREYLILLSICETCKRRGIGFNDFLCSGEVDFERFAEPKFVRARRIARQPASEAVASPRRTSEQTATTLTNRACPTGQLPSGDRCHARNEKEQVLVPI
jgi:hypothetical protein